MGIWQNYLNQTKEGILTLISTQLAVAVVVALRC
jgi:hypothetical protein